MIIYWVHWHDKKYLPKCSFSTPCSSEEEALELYRENKHIEDRYDWEIIKFNCDTKESVTIFKEE